MKTMMHGVLAMLAALLIGPIATTTAARAAPVKTGHVEAELVPETTGAAPGSTLYVALRQKITPGWHTYWRNPGDAGQATSITWTLPQGWSAGDIVWPTPERFIAGPLMNYVFSDEVYLPVPITVPASAKVGDKFTIKGAADWLVCKDVCVPEDATLTLDVPVVAAPQTNPDGGKRVADTLAAAPKAAGLKATFRQDNQGVKLSIVGDAVKGQDVAHAYFFPYNGAVIEQIKPQQAMRGPDGLTFILPPGYEFQHNKPPATLDGVIHLAPGHAFEVSAQPGAPLPGAAGLGGPLVTKDDGKDGETVPLASGASGAGSNLGLLAAIGLSLLGGMILNLMPCVFPVLSIKAAALVRHVEAPARARTEGLAFFVGCVLTFVVLAAVLIGAQKAGQAVGWGFQLQSPGVVAALALIMLAVALNLSGVFEVGLSVQGTGQGLAARSDLIGAFFTGVLAVVVAAPCTAPFMAPAIGWALLQPPIAALSVFAALGVGLALPFVLVSFVPALFKLLPRPGAWMEMLRKILAFPMYGAAAWLAWVFVLEAGDSALPFLLAAAVVLGLAAFLWGVSQHASRPWLSRAFAALALLAVIPLSVVGSGMSAPANASAASPAGPVAGIPTDVWSPDKLASLRAAGKPVFVDFTAAWCVTCQVNERTALATKEVADAFQKTGAVYLKADWTNRNADIARALQAEGRSGVPLYLLYDAKGGGDPKILPQLLTSGAIVEALNAAAKPA